MGGALGAQRTRQHGLDLGANGLTIGVFAALHADAGRAVALGARRRDPDHPACDRKAVLFIHQREQDEDLVAGVVALAQAEPVEALGVYGVLDPRRTPGLLYERADRAHLEALYDGEITYHDVHFQAIMDGLERRHLADDTLVIVTSDHGEEFWDHGSVGHGHSLYEELLHVPMFVRHPGLPQGRIAREVGADVGLVDVLPTIFDALGLPIPSGVAGRSFLPALLGESSGVPQVTVSGFMENWRAVTSADLKLILRANGQHRLFDLSRDPREEHDIAAEQPLAVVHLRAMLGLRLAEAEPVLSGAARRSRPPRHRPQSTTIDAETREQLRALGYLID